MTADCITIVVAWLAPQAVEPSESSYCSNRELRVEGIPVESDVRCYRVSVVDLCACVRVGCRVSVGLTLHPHDPRSPNQGRSLHQSKLAFVCGHGIPSTPPPKRFGASRPMTMAASATSLWGYALAELAPITRQRRCLPDVARKTNVANSSGEKPGGAPHCATLDGATTRRLLDECSSRGVSLESALLASLFLASAAAVSTAEQTEGTGTQVDRHPLGGEGGRGSVSVGAGGYSKPVGIRMQRASVLGIVSVVMALLSGSVDSKALRYFCSFYAVFAGKPSARKNSVFPCIILRSISQECRLDLPPFGSVFYFFISNGLSCRLLRARLRIKACSARTIRK